MFFLFFFFWIIEELRFTQKLETQVVAQVRDYLYFRCDVSYDPVLDVAFIWKHNGQLLIERENIVSCLLYILTIN